MISMSSEMHYATIARMKKEGVFTMADEEKTVTRVVVPEHANYRKVVERRPDGVYILDELESDGRWHADQVIHFDVAHVPAVIDALRTMMLDGAAVSEPGLAAPYIEPTRDEVEAMRETIAHARTMLMMCPCDTDTTKNFQAAVDLFKGSLSKLAQREHANGRQYPPAQSNCEVKGTK